MTTETRTIWKAPTSLGAEPWRANPAVYVAFLAEPGTLPFDGVPNPRPRLALRSPTTIDFEQTQRLRKAMTKDRRWHRESGVWSWSLTTAGCRVLREVIGAGLQVEAGLNAWYAQAAAAEQVAENERIEKLRARRVEAEEKKLGAERALYGLSSTAGPPPVGGGSETVDRILRTAIEVPRLPVADCEPVVPQWIDGPFTPRQSQLDGAAWLSTNGGGVLADEVGLGKTLVCLLAALDGPRALAGVHLIVAPLKPARGTWPEEIKKWAPGAVMLPFEPGRSGFAVEQQRTRALDTSLRSGVHGTKRPVFLVLNHHAAAKYARELAEITWASVVVDEAHEVLTTGHRGGKGDTKIASALMGLQTHDEHGLRVICTGTPFAGRLANIWGLVDWCHPGAAGQHREFVSTYTARVGEHGAGASLDRVADGMEGHWSRFMQDWLLRRTRTAEERAMVNKIVEFVEPTADQLAEDTRWRKRDLWVGIKPEVHVEDGKVVAEKRGKAMVRLEDGAVLPDVILALTRRTQLAVGPMVDIDDDAIIEGRAATYAGPSPKVDKVMELLDGWGLLVPEWWHLAGETGKAIICSPWTSGLDLVRDRLLQVLPPECVVTISGRESVTKVDEAKAAFSGARGPGILLLSAKAGGSGLTLDQHCQRLVFLSEDWIEDTQIQATGRIENRTWQAPREVISIRTRGLLDEYVALRTTHQGATQEGLMALAHAG